MGRPKSLFLNGESTDWHLNLGHHGFVRDVKYQAYRVKLSVLGKQFEIGVTKTQHEAARLYDAAVWRLLPFTSVRAKPNFPDDFDKITQQDVDNRCPYANKLFAECAEHIEQSGATVESLRKLREQSVKAPKFEFASDARNDYSSLVKHFQDVSRESFKHWCDIGNGRVKVNLRKLPELTRRLDEAQSLLKKVVEIFKDLAIDFESHRELYHKFRNM